MDDGLRVIPAPFVSNLSTALGFSSPDDVIKNVDLETLRTVIDVGYYASMLQNTLQSTSGESTPVAAEEFELNMSIVHPSKLVSANVGVVNAADLPLFNGAMLYAQPSPVAAPMILAMWPNVPPAANRVLNNPNGVQQWGIIPSFFQQGALLMPGMTLILALHASGAFANPMRGGFTIMHTSGRGEPRVR